MSNLRAPRNRENPMYRMPALRRALIAALLLLPLLPAWAQEAAVPRAGAWQVISGAPGAPMVGYRVCFNKGGMEDLAQLLPRASPGNPSCSAASTRREGELLIWELHCPDGQFSASARYSVRAESIEGKLTSSAGQPARTREDLIRASYVGACEAP